MAKTIYTYLHKDDLNGSRIITMDNCFCKLFSIRRSDNDFIQQFKTDLEKPALYILLNQNKRRAYIGETDMFLTRLSQHNARKSFWTESLAFISTDDSLSKTEVQYLESLAYNTAVKMGSYDLSENTIVPKSPHMNYMQKSKTEEFFKYVQFLTKFIGCTLFEKHKFKVEKSATNTIPTTTYIQNGDITSESLKGKITILINGKPTYKARLGVAIVREYLLNHPTATMAELKKFFHNGLLGEWCKWNMLEEDLKLAKSLKKTTGAFKHQTNKQFVLKSADSIQFVVANQWGAENAMNLIRLALDQGWDIKIKSEKSLNSR